MQQPNHNFELNSLNIRNYYYAITCERSTETVTKLYFARRNAEYHFIYTLNISFIILELFIRSVGTNGLL